MEPSVNLAGVQLPQPVLVASGTFNYGREYAVHLDLRRLGGIITKGTSRQPWRGNPLPRLAETPLGLLNSIGLENPGVEVLRERELPWLASFGVPVIANIVGETVAEYVAAAEYLSDAPGLSALELNVSCPNVSAGGLAFGQDPEALFEVVAAVRAATKLPLIVKLSPNVTFPVRMAERAVAAGADALSLINTVLGLAIDLERRRPVLPRAVGGLSGPAIKPIALRMVYEVSQAVSVPILGTGGISTWRDALEFILAGATAVAVGTATFVDPAAPLKVWEGLKEYLDREGISSWEELRGAAWA